MRAREQEVGKEAFPSPSWLTLIFSCIHCVHFKAFLFILRLWVKFLKSVHAGGQMSTLILISVSRHSFLWDHYAVCMLDCLFMKFDFLQVALFSLFISERSFPPLCFFFFFNPFILRILMSPYGHTCAITSPAEVKFVSKFKFGHSLAQTESEQVIFVNV